MKLKKIIACILAATATLAIAIMGTGCGVKDWFDEKLGKEEPVLTPEIYAYANGEKITSVDIYDDGDFTFEVKANACADASADVNITSAPEGAKGELTQNEDEWVFVPDKGIEGDYVITITSLVNEELTTTVTVTVAKAPAIETILTGKYQNVGKDKDNNLSITFDADNSQILVIFEGELYNSVGEKVAVKEGAIYEFAYDAETRKANLTFLEMGDDEIAGICLNMCGKEGFTENENVLNSITVNADYTLSVTYYNQTMTADLEPYVEDNTDEIEEELPVTSEEESSSEVTSNA